MPKYKGNILVQVVVSYIMWKDISMQYLLSQTKVKSFHTIHSNSKKLIELRRRFVYFNHSLDLHLILLESCEY